MQGSPFKPLLYGYNNYGKPFGPILEQTQWGEALLRPESYQETECMCLICVFLRCMFIAFIVKLCDFVHQLLSSFWLNFTLFVFILFSKTIRTRPCVLQYFFNKIQKEENLLFYQLMLRLDLARFSKKKFNLVKSCLFLHDLTSTYKSI